MLMLEDYQSRAVGEIVDHLTPPGFRAEGAAPLACVLHAPTGSGKTLMLTRVAAELEARGVSAVLFWTAPFGNITAQTERAIRNEGGAAIRARSLENRVWGGYRTGDVWVTTAALIANSKAGPAEDDEFRPSLRSMGEEIRASGRSVVMIIDEAHLNAKAGTKFIEACQALRPDRYVVATATPDDRALLGFFAGVGVDEARHVIVERDEAIKRHLNKSDLDACFLRAPGAGEVARVEALLSAAWGQRESIAELWRRIGAREEPLLLIQAENGGEAKALREAAKRVTGLDDQAVAIYEASDKQKADLTEVAADPKVKALVFKVAAGTGFDAPRACVLASVRTVRSETSAAQFVGRIMRVPPEIRAFLFANPDHPLREALDTAHLFLIHETGEQAGFEAVSRKLREALIAAGAGRVRMRTFGDAGQEAVAEAPLGPDAEKAIARLGSEGRGWDDLEHLNDQLEPLGLRAYHPRLPGAPDRFRREVWRDAGADAREMMEAMAGAVVITEALVRAEIGNADGSVRAQIVADDAGTVEFEDERRDLRVNAYQAAGADARAALTWACDRLPALSTAAARRALSERVTARVLATGGIPGDDPVIASRVAAILIRMSMGAMKTAALALAGAVETEEAAALPDLVIAQATAARRDRTSLYRHYTVKGAEPPCTDAVSFLREAERLGLRLGGALVGKVVWADESWAVNDTEMALAREMGADENAAIVDWWARNPDRKPWSASLVNAGGDGGNFYPDFVASIGGRIRLLETKHDERDLLEKEARGGAVNADYGEVIFAGLGLNGRLMRKRVVDGRVVSEPLDLRTLI